MQPVQMGQIGQVGHIGQMGRWNNSGREDAGLVQPGSGPGLLALMHDMRNLVASILLYCDLVEEPGVPSPSAHPYGRELRLIANASQRLLTSMSAMTGQSLPGQPSETSLAGYAAQPTYPARRSRLSTGSQPVESLAGEVKANQSLLAALAGPGISLSVVLSGGCEPVAISAENLSRILVNLTRNAAEAMGGKGRILIAVERAEPKQPGPEEGPEPVEQAVGHPYSPSPEILRLTFADSGPGIPASALEAVFSPGYTTHLSPGAPNPYDDSESPFNGLDFPAETGQWPDPAGGRGLGLSIVRSLVASAGGSVRAVSRAGDSAVLAAFVHSQRPGADSLTGAVFVLEFPILSSHSPPVQRETNVPLPLSRGASSGIASSAP